MHNLTVIESCYRKFVQDMTFWIPEDIVEVDLHLLQQLDLLHYKDPQHRDSSLTRYFHVIESMEKITLINDDFVVWIIPETNGDFQLTYTLIAINRPEEPQLECCFVTSGVYNNSRLVLQILEKFLSEIQENEDAVKKLA